MAGKVTLVGAGPGDAGLLTVKGREALEQAEVVVYDRLVSGEILALIPESAQCIDVGKNAGRHPVPQEEINRILLEQGQAGKNVVRLKGGDPFLFGRGGEELELLAEHGIPFEEIPGVTSAIAAAAYAGIPVTHRDFCSSLHIVTGHRRAGEPLDIDFDALRRVGGTLVFLMGVSALPDICDGLLSAGMNPETPAAVVERGTTPRQRRVSASLVQLPSRAAEENIASPAVIVVGGVCSLAKQFCWFDALPLKGRRVVVTRPKERSGTLTNRLRALGADVLECPCIQTVPIEPCRAMEQAVKNLVFYEWLVFTSPAGVERLWAFLDQNGLDARALGTVKLAAIGPGTDRALREHGVHADLIPDVYDAQHLGVALAPQADGRILLLRAEEASPALPQALERAGLVFDDISVYRTIYDLSGAEALRSALAAGEVDDVTFTSASTVKGFLALVGEGMDLSHLRGICIGEQTAAEARRVGIPVVVAKQATIDAMLDRMTE